MRYASSDLVSDPLTRSRSQSPIPAMRCALARRNSLVASSGTPCAGRFALRRERRAAPRYPGWYRGFFVTEIPCGDALGEGHRAVEGLGESLINRTTKPAALTSVMTVAARTIQTCRFTLSATFSIFACSLRS